MPEAISEACIVTYADDTTVYLAHSNVDTVYNGLEKAADEILLYMRSNCPAANAEKTKFVMFGQKKSSKIQVGPGYVEESEAEVLLGVKISKNLTWTKQVEKLRLELSRRVGIIRRLSHQIPRHTKMKVLTPIFTSKLQYTIKIFTDPSGAICEGRKQDSLLETPQISQNKGMRAALGRGSNNRSRTEELLALTGQPSVL
jgi:hypothetical protein